MTDKIFYSLRAWGYFGTGMFLLTAIASLMVVAFIPSLFIYGLITGFLSGCLFTVFLMQHEWEIRRSELPVMSGLDYSSEQGDLVTFHPFDGIPSNASIMILPSEKRPDLPIEFCDEQDFRKVLERGFDLWRDGEWQSTKIVYRVSVGVRTNV